jgi:two-component system chemotaxis response regulator CheB
MKNQEYVQMADKIKVLVVDDSAFMRKFISDMINNEPDMEVVDTAKDGDSAVNKVKSLAPDVVTLDVEMPGKNGLEVLREIKNTGLSQVIMFSGLTARGSSITIEALRMGAFDFVQKPSGFKYFKIDEIKKELVEKIRYAGACKRKLQGKSDLNCRKGALPISMPGTEEYRERSAGGTSKLEGKIKAVALGASTGGPKVLYDVITKLPPDLNVPVFVVQHMPPGFTKAFAERLDNNSFLQVSEAFDGEPVRPGKVYVAPGGYHMLIEDGKIKLDSSPPVHGVRPAADKLFVSAAEVYKEGLLCCVFTGMGKDGAEGVKAVKAMGGVVLAQDEATSVVYGMPKAAFETGCVDMVLPDYKIAEQIIRYIKGL